MSDALKRMNVADVDQFNEYEERIAELEQALADKERHNELLRAALLCGTLCLKPESESFPIYMEKIQAASDGGALDKDGE